MRAHEYEIARDEVPRYETSGDNSKAERISEELLFRLHQYLATYGVRLTPEVERRVLTIVGKSLASNSETSFRRALSTLNFEFQFPSKKLPQPTPALCRGSMSYGER